MPAPATDRAAQQQAILDAAVRTLARKGYGAASLAAIAEEAGTTKRMLLYYFESREQLLLGMTDQVATQMVERALADADEPAPTVGDAVADSFRASWARLADDPTLLRAYLVVLADPSDDAVQRGALERIRRAHREIFDSSLERAREAGIQPPVDVDVLSVVLFATFRGLILELLERGPTPALEGAVDYVATILRALFGGQ